MKSETLSVKAIVKELDCLKKTVIIQWNSWWKGFMVAYKQSNGKMPYSRNAKERYQSSIRKKITKSVKQSGIITYQPKTFQNPNNVDIKYIQKLQINYPRL